MNLSYWEYETWMRHIDFAIVGSGIVGLSCALSLRKKHPKSKIVVFERGMLPSGASTKNAGFACFGSASELLDDLKTHSEAEVVDLVQKRLAGLRLLRDTLGDPALDYQELGGYEVFRKEDSDLFRECEAKIPYLNELLKEVFLNKKEVFSVQNDPFSFKNVQNRLIFNRYEGQLDTGKMMKSLLQKCIQEDILILNTTEVTSFQTTNLGVEVQLNDSVEITTQHLFITTNGFAKQLLNEEVAPARAQVLITDPIPNLQIKGTFHLEKGYYYFRNIHNRILLGGGRNLDFEGETTTTMETTQRIQDELERLLHTTILPNTAFKISSRWSGIMGVGAQKKPIVKELEPRVYCGVRLGGMGVALGSSIGAELSSFTN
ncbi:FAD-dependent oxidoreductase [Aureisphaera galaxeae]|uniref:NAD(P)/FAD-dependent oxidoreductase n=1 Tax=Aureisphaera galaxeae TaxID=1538023 RepID=UPI00234FDBB1|nr:FAD-dependent oxidoreductase [Aureisphaera galaxeae]MDC8005137.1 FAD-dependent oxidoreductase [Aureisphaera galaxeae]